MTEVAGITRSGDKLCTKGPTSVGLYLAAGRGHTQESVALFSSGFERNKQNLDFHEPKEAGCLNPVSWMCEALVAPSVISRRKILYLQRLYLFSNCPSGCSSN